MRSLTSKRVFGVVAATAMTAASVVSLASISDAATLAKYKVDTTTSAGQVITITGKDFTDDAGVPQFDTDGIRFSTAACATTQAAASATNTAYVSSAAVNAVAVSDTKITLDTTGFTPTLTGGKAKYNVCVFDNASTAALLGTAATTFYAPPATITAGVAVLAAGKLVVGSSTIATGNVATAMKGSSLGGTKISAKGVDFTAKSYITVGGKKLLTAKTTLGKTSSDDDLITGLTPPGTNTAAPIKIVGEFGAYPLGVNSVSGGAGLTLAYTPTVTVSPTGSDGTAGRIVTVTGTGFDDMTFVGATGAGTGGGKSVVYLLPVGVDLTTDLIASANSATPTGGFVCASPKSVIDTEVTCALPSGMAAVPGGYNVVVATFTGAAAAQTVASNTQYSRGSAYTVAPF